MRRTLLPMLAAVSLLAGCADPASGPADGSVSASPEASSDRLDIYEPLIREMAGLEGMLPGPLYIRRGLCENAADIEDEDEVCDDAFTDAEQRELAARLADAADDVRFVEDWEGMGVGDNLANPEQAVFVWVGTTEEKGDDLWIGAGMWCGGLCGHGGTFVLSPRGDGWVVDGNAPGTGMWIS